MKLKGVSKWLANWYYRVAGLMGRMQKIKTWSREESISGRCVIVAKQFYCVDLLVTLNKLC